MHDQFEQICNVGVPVAVTLVANRLLDQDGAHIRYLRYSLKAAKAYVYWARFFGRCSRT